MFGREARLPIDVMFGLPPEESVSPSHYALLWRRRMEAAYHHVHYQLLLQQCRQKTLYDRKVAGAPYCIGDLVWLQGSFRKLHCPWKGPYRIIKVITDVTYRVQQSCCPLRSTQNHTMDNGKVVPQRVSTPTGRSDPVTSPDTEDELVVVYPSPPVQTSPKPSLQRSSR